MNKLQIITLLPVLLILFTGCGGPTGVSVPSINPSASAESAMDEYDKDKDGFIDQSELKTAYSLKEAEKFIDTNKDGKLSKDEIEQRLKKYAGQGMGLLSFSCSVFYNGARQKDVEVEMIPEKFMLNSIKSAKGKSDANGMVRFRQEGNEHEGVQPGFYKIKAVSSKLLAIPAQFNETTKRKPQEMSWGLS